MEEGFIDGFGYVSFGEAQAALIWQHWELPSLIAEWPTANAARRDEIIALLFASVVKTSILLYRYSSTLPAPVTPQE